MKLAHKITSILKSSKQHIISKTMRTVPINAPYPCTKVALKAHRTKNSLTEKVNKEKAQCKNVSINEHFTLRFFSYDYEQI